MRTVMIEPPAEVEAWLEQRRALGQDRFDEVWNGEYHVAPAPHGSHGSIGWQLATILGDRLRGLSLIGVNAVNLGDAGNYRVPDAGFLREEPDTFTPTAAVVVEILSPNDETWNKFTFYFEHNVDELLVVDPRLRTVSWFTRGPAGFESRAASLLLNVTAADLAAAIRWPGTRT